MLLHQVGEKIYWRNWILVNKFLIFLVMFQMGIVGNVSNLGID